MKKGIKTALIVLAGVIIFLVGYRLTKSDLFVSSSSWAKSYDIDYSIISTNLDDGRGIVQTPDGGYIVTGTTSGEQNGTFLVMRLNPKGSVIWAKQFGKFDGEPTCITKTNDNCYLIGGWTYSRKFDQISFLIKIDLNGNIKWVKSYGRIKTKWFDFAGLNESKLTSVLFVYSISQTSDGGFVLAGIFGWRGAGPFDKFYPLVIKLNKEGDVEWIKAFKEDANNGWGFTSISQTSDGGFMAMGSTTYYDVFLVKLSSNGKVEWAKALEDKFAKKILYAHSLALLSDGGAIICGRHEETGESPDTSDTFLTRINRNGEVLWAKTYGGNKYDSVSSILKTSDDNFLVVGETDSFNGGILILKVDGDGNIKWSRVFGAGSKLVYLYSPAALTSDGGFVITGETEGFVPLLNFDVGNSNALVAKFDREGNIGGKCGDSSGSYLKEYSLNTSLAQFNAKTVSCVSYDATFETVPFPMKAVKIKSVRVSTICKGR